MDIKKMTFAIEPGDAPLILDHVWQRLFASRRGDEHIAAIQKRLVELMKERSALTERGRLLELKKRDYLRRINNMTRNVFVSRLPNHRKLMTRLRAEVININAELEYVESGLAGIEGQIRKNNVNLMEETAFICYNEYTKSNSRLAEIEPEAEELQRRLDGLLDERGARLKVMKDDYIILHKLLGQREMDKLDGSSYDSGVDFRRITRKASLADMPPITRPERRYTLLPKAQTV